MILFCMIISGQIGQAKTLTFSSEGWCPYACDPAKNNGDGYLIDIVKAVFEKKDFVVNYEIMPYKRAIKLTRSGKINAIVGIYKEDAPDLVFPSVSQGLSHKHFFVKSSNQWRYSGVSSLYELSSIGTMLGYDYAEATAFYKNHKERVSVMSGADMLKLTLKQLRQERIQTFADDISVVKHMMKKMLIPPNLIITAGVLGKPNKVYIAFSPNIDESQYYAEDLSQGLKQLRESGQLAEILKKYDMKDWLE